MRSAAWALIASAVVWQGGCTYHVAIGGQGNLRTDGATASERVPKGRRRYWWGPGRACAGRGCERR
jgi:hypothetical protein